MRTTTRTCLLSTLILLLVATSIGAYAQTAQQLVTVSPCRLIDTRTSGGPIQGGTSRTFNLPQLATSGGCNSLATATSYSLNVTVVPQGRLGFLTIWPTGQPQPGVSLMNSLDGRIKANAVIVAGGTSGSVDVFVNNTTDVILDIDGYFEPSSSSALAFYPLVPCRIVDTRSGNGGPLQAGVERDFPLSPRECNIAGAAKAYSFNVTAVPIDGGRVGFVTVWPAGIPRPNVSTLNDPTGTIVANAAIVPSGAQNTIAAYANNNTNLLIDINGYFAPPASGGLALYTQEPCRALDTRPNAFTGEIVADIVGSGCGVPSTASGYVLNATALPQGRLGYLTVWPDGESQPSVSTLNAIDGAFTSNMAIVAAAGLPADGSVDAYAANGTTNLLLDVFGYLGLNPTLTVTTTSLPNGTTGIAYNASLAASGGEPPYTWTLAAGSLPPGLSLSSTGVISGTPETAGSFQFTVQVEDSLTATANANLSITIVSGSLTITTTALPSGNQGAPYNATLGVAGGTPPYTWSIASGTLPSGLNLNPTSGVISGTPAAQGTSNFQVQVTDSLLNTAQKALSIIIGAPLTNGTLSGNYTFSFNGYNNGKPVFMAGSFVADGSGTLTSGELDLNSGGGSAQPNAFTGTYNLTLGNGLGTMTFNVNGLGTMNFHVAVSNLGNGTMIQNNADPNTRGSGSIYVQNTADFIVPPHANYAIGTFGADQNFARYAKGGVMQVGSTGNVISGSEDDNDNGTLGSRTFAGQFNPPDSHGRGQLLLSFPGGVTNTYAYYVIFRGQFIVMGVDPLSDVDPLTMASMLVQSGTFTNSSLSGKSIAEINGVIPNGGSPEADAQLGLFTVTSPGNATISLDENRGGTMIAPQISSGTFNVANTGRVTLTGFGGTPPILYLSNANQAFVVGQDANVSSGILEPQVGPPPYSNLSIFGTYLGGIITPVQSAVVDAAAFLFADGNGNINGTEDTSGPLGSGSNSVSVTYLVDSTGRTVLTGMPAGIMYVVSSKKVVFLPSGDNPALSTFVTSLTH